MLRKQLFRSLTTKIILLVFLSSFLTTLVVSWVPVHSTYGFLRSQLQQRFPRLLAGSVERVSSWLDGGALEIERLAVDLAVAGALSGQAPAGRSEELLSQALGRTDFFAAFVLVDASGRTVAAATGEDSSPLPNSLGDLDLDPSSVSIRTLPDAGGVQTPVAVVALGPGRDRVLATLCGVFHEGALSGLLDADPIGAGGEFQLFDASGELRGRSGPADREPAPMAAELSRSRRGEVRRYRSDSAGWMVGAALPLRPLGWTLVAEQPLAQAFEPLVSVMTRLLVIDLCIVLLLVLATYRGIATWVQPIEALSEGAQRISHGELEVEVPCTRGSDEVGLLIRTFNDMAGKLLHHRSEIHEANRKLQAQNDELQQANEILEQLSITDGLTKLHNHRFFQEHLTREIKRVERSREPLSLLLLDIDDFKQLNDHFGHVAGDELLVGLAQVLSQAIRDSDLVARYGGEEFAVLAANTDLTGAVNLGEKIRMAVAESGFIVDDSMRPTRMTISIGVAQYRGSRKQLLRRADRALYRAKDEGKDCVMAEEADPVEAGPDAFVQET